MDSQIEQLADSFVENLSAFRVDATLRNIELREQLGTYSVLAASGRRPVRSDYTRGGVLSNAAQDMLVRVFRHRSDAQLQLYFLHSSTTDLNGAIVTAPNTFQFYSVGKKNRITIPESADINPVRNSLKFTMPDYRMEIPREEIEQTTVTDNGLTVLVQAGDFSDDNILPIECILNGESLQKLPTKMLVRSDKFSRLIPVQNNRAIFQIPKDFLSGLEIFCYE
ncbi:MAG: hypothetical protein MAGBODY4_00405 [Candidatus Marinimicrobia bacterium]|nr:hypothetical protein [Candidatus Neomarinimicrobiota bacterium]